MSAIYRAEKVNNVSPGNDREDLTRDPDGGPDGMTSFVTLAEIPVLSPFSSLLLVVLLVGVGLRLLRNG
jgi:hypothetical protein